MTLKKKIKKYGLISVWIVCAAGLAMAQDSASLDELLDLETSTPSESPPKVSIDPLTEKLPGELPGVFEQVIEQMQEVSVRLGRSYDPGLETQRQIESILEKLDQVIEQIKQQQSQSSKSGGSGGSTSGDRQSDEVAPQGNAGKTLSQSESTTPSAGDASRGTASQAQPDTRPMESLQREWGDLPPRLRDELREGLIEKFSPIYQRLTEAYYRKLAEEQ